jgi:Uma2 family endonuclease
LLVIAFGPSAGFRLPDGSVRAPDASWVSRAQWARLTPEDREAFAPVCPEVVFEIALRTDRPADLRAKMALYIENGAHLAVRGHDRGSLHPGEGSIEEGRTPTLLNF